jgi:hypothetical protein
MRAVPASFALQDERVKNKKPEAAWLQAIWRPKTDEFLNKLMYPSVEVLSTIRLVNEFFEKYGKALNLPAQQQSPRERRLRGAGL